SSNPKNDEGGRVGFHGQEHSPVADAKSELLLTPLEAFEIAVAGRRQSVDRGDDAFTGPLIESFGIFQGLFGPERVPPHGRPSNRRRASSFLMRRPAATSAYASASAASSSGVTGSSSSGAAANASGNAAARRS